MEHRWGQRTKVSISVLLHPRRPFAVLPGRIVNISASGGLIRTNIPIPVLTCMKVEILSNDEESAVTLTACVVRQTRDGVGVEWCDAPSAPVLAAASGRFRSGGLNLH